jgi:hypothetical protein
MKVSEWKAERTRYHEGAMIAAVYVALTLAFAHRKTVFKTGY